MSRILLAASLAALAACDQPAPSRDTAVPTPASRPVAAPSRAAPAATPIGHDTAAPTRASRRVIALKNGANAIDLLGDGTKAQVFVAWRENYNAHGHSTVAFTVFVTSYLGDTTGVWQVVPFVGGARDGDDSREIYRTSEGADCTTGDLRVLRREHAPIEIVIARRELGESMVDPTVVRFDYYKVAQNADGVPGWPPYYFEYSRTVSTKRPYCDVNAAFHRELGLGRIGLGHGDGLQ